MGSSVVAETGRRASEQLTPMFGYVEERQTAYLRLTSPFEQTAPQHDWPAEAVPTDAVL